MEPKRALLLGGTGAIGRYLAPALSARGFQVNITSRLPRASNNGVRYIQGDALDDDFLKVLLKDEAYDVIVDFMVYDTPKFVDRLNVLLLGAGQYIFTSSYRVYADDGTLVEGSRRLLDYTTDQQYLRTDEYALAKARQEDALRAGTPQNWTIVRPGITYSTGRFQLGCLEAASILRRSWRGVPVPIPHAMLGRKTTLTWGGDVAELIARLAGNSAALTEDFNVLSSESTTWRQIADVYSACIGTEVIEVDLDGYIGALGGGLAKYRVLLDRMVDRTADNSKVLSATGFDPAEFTHPHAGLKRELANFAQNPQKLPVDPALEARLDNLTGKLAGLSDMSLKEQARYVVHRAPKLQSWMARRRDRMAQL